jgi:hypothetical protein
VLIYRGGNISESFLAKKFGNMGKPFCTGGLYLTGIILAKNDDFA